MAKKTKAAKKPKVKPLLDQQTPQQKCQAAHAGQAGYCDEGGGWHPAT